jgi:hypothetical protein
MAIKRRLSGPLAAACHTAAMDQLGKVWRNKSMSDGCDDVLKVIASL